MRPDQHAARFGLVAHDRIGPYVVVDVYTCKHVHTMLITWTSQVFKLVSGPLPFPLPKTGAHAGLR
jgi:hypothetical protein